MPPSLRVSVGVPPSRYRHRLAQVERQRHRLAGVKVAAPPVMPLPEVVTDDTVGVVVSICGPLWVRPVSDRLAALPAPSVTVAELRLTAVAARADGVLPGADRVAEGQRIGAGAARVGGGAAVVEGQRRGAAGHRHRLAQVERQRDGLAGIEVAARRRLGQRRDGRRRGVDLQAPAGLVTAPVRLAALPAPSVDRAAVERCTAVTARSEVFCPAPTV